MGLEKDVKLRLLHLEEMSEMFRAVGEQPLQMLDIISGVKSPFRFKQLCEDWAGYCKDPGYTSGQSTGGIRAAVAGGTWLASPKTTCWLAIPTALAIALLICIAGLVSWCSPS